MQPPFDYSSVPLEVLGFEELRKELSIMNDNYVDDAYSVMIIGDRVQKIFDERLWEMLLVPGRWLVRVARGAPPITCKRLYDMVCAATGGFNAGGVQRVFLGRRGVIVIFVPGTKAVPIAWPDLCMQQIESPC